MNDFHLNLQELNFTALDFETANERRDSICAIGLISVMSGKIIERKKILVQPPELRFSTVNVRLHGITVEDTREAPIFSTIWEQIKGWIENKIVVAHNVDFDIDALKQTLTFYGCVIPTFKTICTQKLAQEVFHDLVNYRLNDVALYLGLNHSHHDCLSDAEIAAQIGIRAIPLFPFSPYNFSNEELTHYIHKKSSAESVQKNFSAVVEKKHINKDLLTPNLNNADPNNIFITKKLSSQET